MRVHPGAHTRVMRTYTRVTYVRVRVRVRARVYACVFACVRVAR